MRSDSARLARAVMLVASLILVSTGAAPLAVSAATEALITEVGRNVYALSAPAANAIIVVDEAGCLYAGPQVPALIHAAKALSGRLNCQFRWAVMTDDDIAPQRRDGGWGESGALTITHENLRRRMQRWKHPDTATALPLLSFSHVQQLWLKTEEVHLIHDQSGYSNADMVVHVEKSGVLYTGNLFTSDGYPSIRLDNGGSVSELIVFARYFIRNFHANTDLVEPIVPGRGPLATVRDLQDYCAMLIAIHESIGELATRGFPLERILAIGPTKPFDARWGNGPVSAATFTTQVYDSFTKTLQKNVPPAQKSHEHVGASPLPEKH